MTDWELEYEHSGASFSDVRSALDGLTASDLSDTSPVTAGADEVNVQVSGGGSLLARIPDEGNSRFTSKSELAMHDAIISTTNVDKLVRKQGGRLELEFFDENDIQTTQS